MDAWDSERDSWDLRRSDRNEDAQDHEAGGPSGPSGRPRASAQLPSPYSGGSEGWNDPHNHGSGGGASGNGGWRNLPSGGPRRGELAERRDPPPPAYAPAPAYAEAIGDGDSIDIRKYIGILLKHRWLVLAVAIAIVAVGLVYTLLQTPIYRGTATIEIKRDVSTLDGVPGLDSGEGGGGAEFYQTQYQLLKSRALAERIVAKLRLGEQPDFVATKGSLLSRVKSTIFGGGDQNSNNAKRNEAIAIGRVRGGLSVQPIRGSQVVAVSFDSSSPRFAQEVANAAVTSFVDMNLERSYEASAHARKFLEERLQDLKTRLEDSERKLVDYAEEKDILVTSGEGSLAQTNLESTNESLSTAAKERLRQELLWNQVKGKDTLPQSLENEAIKTFRAKRADLLVEYQEKLKVFKPGFPDMVSLKSQIDELDTQIRLETERIKDSIQAQYEAAKEHETSLTKELANLKRSVTDYQERNIEYTILKREVDTNRSLYEGLLQRYKELSVAGGGGNPSNISVVDEAQRPGGPYKPNLKQNLAISLALGVIFGGMAAFGREFIDDSFNKPEEVEEILGLPLVGLIPDVEDTKYHSEMEDPRSALNEAYRSLRTALQFSTSAGVPKTLLVTSSRPGEGKSSTALNVARHFALLGMRVLLIDADLRKPSLHRRLGSTSNRGLSNCLVGTASPPEVVQRTDYPNLEFMASGPLPPDPTDLLASSRMASLLSVASEKYDLVVVDSAPVGGMADALILSNFAQGCIHVVEAHKMPRNGVVNALKRLQFARAEVLGVVLNKYNFKQSGYNYGYGYYGYYGYGAENQLTDGASDEYDEEDDEETHTLLDRSEGR
ncbi:GumC family protein [Amorphus sp. 3PC139-8]|uniref:GumC family protein n=1 Tax=Amorphus sp. 3PC139-8 TaxID=2735676 RepID=UPI00345CF07C